MPLIQIEALHKDYVTAAGRFPVLKGINLSIERSEFVTVMGPSGSGKSTFMNILGCLDTPTSGSYHLDGQEVGRLDANRLATLRSRTIGFVFQGFNLLPRLTTLDNVALPLVYTGVPHRERLERAAGLLAQVGLAERGHHLPNQLSGGQQQRVAIARALINEPPLILADEPTGNLDSVTSAEIMQLFARLNGERGITIVLVTHEADIARYAQRLVHFFDGRISEDGPVRELLGEPA